MSLWNQGGGDPKKFGNHLYKVYLKYGRPVYVSDVALSCVLMKGCKTDGVV
jgi:hypothetical protein